MTVNKDISRLAQGIRDRREAAAAAADTDPDKPISAVEALRAASHGESDASLARIAKLTHRTDDQKES